MGRDVSGALGVACSTRGRYNAVEQAAWSRQPQACRAEQLFVRAAADCKQIGSCDEANWYLQNCSWGGKLDRDKDGIPCESLC
ncbi:excalibur calcium-binding domain-containing protein [Mesorhizobium sp. M1060]|uniref:excalibur calcium-binding domain-containing protein n=1 Tax=Mesorhizobium sp. M1060 TaxID=2957052 RepID=UPI00333C780D